MSGHNMAIDFNGSDEAVEGYLSLDGSLFVNEEQAVIDVIRAAGGTADTTTNLRAAVITRGDRFGSVSDIFMARNDPEFESRTQLYREDYGFAFKPYTGQA